MDQQWQRLQWQALFSPASAALGRALRQHPADASLTSLLACLPEGLRAQAALLDDFTPLQQHYQRLTEQGWQWLALGDDTYPALLAELDDAPGVLAVRGDLAVLQQPALAMVGARGASADGLETSRRFARQLAASGFVIVSGLARGVDQAAHLGALESGRTVAVMGTGPDRIYPARHRALADKIVASGGALVTEFAPGSAPLARHFPQRNRLVSGLSLATLVMEAAIKSGSLITARTALAQGREVFAVPGSLHNPLSRGCHQLLRDGASWLESVDDIFAAFGDFRRCVEQACERGELQASPAPPLLQHLTHGLNSLDMIQQRSGLSTAALASELAELELEGWVEKVSGGYLRGLG